MIGCKDIRIKRKQRYITEIIEIEIYHIIRKAHFIRIVHAT